MLAHLEAERACSDAVAGLACPCRAVGRDACPPARSSPVRRGSRADGATGTSRPRGRSTSGWCAVRGESRSGQRPCCSTCRWCTERLGGTGYAHDGLLEVSPGGGWRGGSASARRGVRAALPRPHDRHRCYNEVVPRTYCTAPVVHQARRRSSTRCTTRPARPYQVGGTCSARRPRACRVRGPRRAAPRSSCTPQQDLGSAP